MTQAGESDQVQTILRAWGEVDAVAQAPFGRSNPTLTAMARVAVQSLTGGREWTQGDRIPATVELVYTADGQAWRRIPRRTTTDIGDRWETHTELDEPELLASCGPLHEREPKHMITTPMDELEGFTVGMRPSDAVPTARKLLGDAENAMRNARDTLRALADLRQGYVRNDHASAANVRASHLDDSLNTLRYLHGFLNALVVTR